MRTASALIVMERDREQADLPTEQPPSGEDPRVPASDAYPRRPRHPGGPPSQGPQRTVGLSRPVGVLPAANRLRSSADFATVTRSGRRVRSGDVVVYLAAAPSESDPSPRSSVRLPSDQTAAIQAGLIVGRKVGGSVIRHQVSRRLRAQLAERLVLLPAGCRLVVRALPSAAGTSSRELGAQLDHALAKLVKPAKSGIAPPSGRDGGTPG
jgi:ribonuclease P protein component